MKAGGVEVGGGGEEERGEEEEEGEGVMEEEIVRGYEEVGDGELGEGGGIVVGDRG